MVQAGNTSVSDLREFMRDWTQLEKEYGQKLESMVKKYQKIKEKKTSTMSVGGLGSREGLGKSGPLVDFNTDTDSSSYVKAWDQLLHVTSAICREHFTLSERIHADIVEPAQVLSQKKEDARKKHVAYCQKLLEMRDEVYADKDKKQAKYTELGTQTHAMGSKVERSINDKNHDKYRRQYQKALVEKNNAQNLYILSVHRSNAIKNEYFHKDIPILMNQLQDINHSRIESSRALWTRWIDLQNEALQRLHGHMSELRTAVNLIDPAGDAQLFVARNPVAWSEPLDFQFIPVPHSNDRGEMVVDDEDARIFLANVMHGEQETAQKLSNQLDQLRVPLGDVEQSLRAADPGDPTGPWHELFDNSMNLSHELMNLEWEHTIHQTEAADISQVLGIPGGSGSNVDFAAHKFRPHSFAIPTSCDYCHSKLWSVGKSEQMCEVCGYNVHKKCLLKVPLDCPGSVSALRRRRSLGRTPSMSQTSSVNNFSTTSIPLGSGSSVRGVPPPPPYNASLIDTRSPGDMGWSSSEDETIVPATPLSLSAVGGGGASGPRRNKKPPPPPGTAAFNESGVLNPRRHSRVAPPPPRPATMSSSAFAAAAAAAVKARSSSFSSAADSGGGGGLSTAPGMIAASGSSRNNSTGSAYGPGGSSGLKGASLGTATALYSYQSKSGTDMDLRSGDVLNVVRKDVDGSGWTECELNGRRGLVPTNYIQMTNQRDGGGGGHAGAGSVGAPPMATMQPHGGSKTQRWARALFDFDARDASELTIKTNDEIIITNDHVCDGWMEGTLHGQTGQFPSNFVQTI
ncbi:Protein BZZ1 [Tieghemiomyces parasiticus]|uniref:Protein BZZ1 n=1 Tax=Tieghemiomyces parasiticus TaxID=78921 RepID=A0A9W8A8D7_9FUNG|nr:Protein BZZ1 [Tieghemiomyces parasiticus]